MTEYETLITEKLDDLIALDTEAVAVLGDIQSYLLFFVVCLLLWASYKIIRMFF